MTRFKAIFVHAEGLEERDIGSSYGLSADSLDAAEQEALALPAPDGANFVKLLDEGWVVKTVGLPVDA